MNTFKKAAGAGVVAAVLLTAGAVAQDVTMRPGEMTQNRVWVQNRNASESIPVAIESIHPAAEALPVRIEASKADFVLPVRTRRQAWEYLAVTAPMGKALTALNDAGGEGWEVAGIFSTPDGSALFVMKRPR